MERRIKGVLSPKASGSITITENGNYDVVDVANAIVDVRPSGTIEITENGEHDVANYEKANVNVQSKEKTLKGYLDVVKTLKQAFYQNTEITNIGSFIGYKDTENVTTMNQMFYRCSSLVSYEGLDTQNVTDMGGMFYYCEKLSGDVSFNSKKVTNISSMFSNCISLTSISQLETSNVTNMSYAFEKCKALISLPKLDTKKVDNMYNAFKNCEQLKKIDLSYYNISSTYNATNSFSTCYKLDTLIIREFGENYVLNTNSLNYTLIANKKGYIYVPRAMVDTLKSETNWSTYATQIRALEDYTIDGTTTGEIDESKLV